MSCSTGSPARSASPRPSRRSRSGRRSPSPTRRASSSAASSSRGREARADRAGRLRALGDRAGAAGRRRTVRSAGWCSRHPGARSAAAAAPRCTRRHPGRGARAPDLGHGPRRHDELGDPGQQGSRGDRGAPAVRRAVRPHRGDGAPAVDRALDGRVRRRLHDRAGQPARHAAADLAGARLAAPRPGCRRSAGLDDRADLEFEPLDAERVPGRRRSPSASARRAAPTPPCSTPPTSRRSRPSTPAGSATSTSSTPSSGSSTPTRRGRTDRSTGVLAAEAWARSAADALLTR